MTLQELIQASNQAVEDAPEGSRPALNVSLTGKLRQRRVPLGFGISGRVLGWNGSEENPRTVVRVFADEVHRALVKAGIATLSEEHG